MANPRHLEIVRAGPEMIRRWRRENPGQQLDLTEAPLAGENLVDCDLSGANMFNVKLAGANLCNANLTGADLSGGDLQQAVLMGADLTDATLNGAWLTDVALNDTILCRTDFTFAKLENIQLCGAELDYTCVLAEADLTKANLDATTGLIFDGNRISGAWISPQMGDPWSVLKTKYSGPKMVLHLILVTLALAPFILEAIWWLLVARLQDRYEDLPGLDGPSYPLILVVLGWHKGVLATSLSLVILVYNAIRGFITVRVSSFRDLEDRTRITPHARSYLYLYQMHRVASLILVAVLAITAWRVLLALTTVVQLPA